MSVAVAARVCGDVLGKRASSAMCARTRAAALSIAMGWSCGLSAAGVRLNRRLTMNIHKHHDHSIRAKRLGEDLLRTMRALVNTPTDAGADEGPWSDAWHAKDDADCRFADCVRHLPGGRDEGARADVDALDF